MSRIAAGYVTAKHCDINCELNSQAEAVRQTVHSGQLCSRFTCGKWGRKGLFLVCGLVVKAKRKGNVRKLGLSDTYSDQSGVYFLFTDVRLTIEMHSSLIAGFPSSRAVFANKRNYSLCTNVPTLLVYYWVHTAPANTEGFPGVSIRFPLDNSVLVYNLSSVSRVTLYLTFLPLLYTNPKTNAEY